MGTAPEIIKYRGQLYKLAAQSGTPAQWRKRIQDAFAAKGLPALRDVIVDLKSMPGVVFADLVFADQQHADEAFARMRKLGWKVIHRLPGLPVNGVLLPTVSLKISSPQWPGR